MKEIWRQREKYVYVRPQLTAADIQDALIANFTPYIDFYLSLN